MSWAARLHHWFRQMVRASCLLCGTYAQGATLCARCASHVAKTPWGVTGLDCGSARIPVLWRETYGGPLTDTIYRSKYRGDWGSARLLGQCLGQLPRPWLGPDPILVPIPLADHRLAHRGYNQSHMIALQTARFWQVPVRAQWLRKIKRTARQASLAQTERKENLLGSFVASSRLQNRRVILIDDIMTSGATLKEAARAVADRGGQVIAAAVIAHVPKPHRRLAAKTQSPRHVQRRFT